MEWKQIEGKWRDVTPHVRQRWDKLTEDDVRQIAGNRERLVGKLRERYGLSAHHAEEQVEEFRESLTSASRR